MKPVIAIVGKPNVGKSTLFNRIVGRRKALVNDTPGVTRDRHYADADWCGKEFLLIDTGGIADGEDHTIQNFIKKQTMTAVNEADIIICLFDGRDGPTPLDVSIIRMLRKSGKPVLYAINKLEKVMGRRYGIKSEPSEFFELGIKDQMYTVSSEHGVGVDALLDGVLENVKEAEAPSVPVDDRIPRIAVIGRPNAGKSTLVNRLFGNERVIAHDMPGTTRDTIDVEILLDDKKFIFVDTAGLKKKGKTIEALDKYSAIKTLDAIHRADIALLVVDSNDGFTHQDSALLEHAYEEGKGVLVLFNKWDALTHDAKELKKFYDDKLFKLHKVPFLCISAKTGAGTDKIFEEIEKIRHTLTTRLSTSTLNRVLEEVKEQHNIPSHKGRPVKIYYAAQIKTKPPTFVVFSNRPEGIGEGYKRYLINRFQEIIGYGVPIRIKFKKK